MGSTIKKDTLDFIYEVTRHGPVDQLRRADSLDGKVIQVFAAASIVIGLAGLSKPDMATAKTVFMIAGLASYGVVAAASLWAVWIRSYWHPFHSDTLLDDYWQNTVEEVKYALADEFPRIYSENKRILNIKGWAARVAIIATAVEVAAVGAMIISSQVA